MPGHRHIGGIGYVLKKFPVLSETFILNEVLALEALGIRVHIFSLERPNDPRFHAGLSRLKASVSYVPDISDLRTLFRHQRQTAKRYRKGYLRALTHVLAKGRPTLFGRFLQACYVANEARRLRLEHFHAHFATRPTTAAFLASMISGIPYSFSAHAMDIFKARLSRQALAKKVEKAKFVVTVSDYNKTYLEKLAESPAGKIVRVYNGIDLLQFCPNGVAPAVPFTIVCVARLVEKKGLPVLIEACGMLRERGVGFRCWIVGKGRMRGQLDSLIRRWKLSDHVQLLGPHTHDEVLERYRSAHVYALPCVVGSDGNRDGLPVSIVEALACGLPVITTRMTGIPEVVRHQHNGLLVAQGDPSALADALESVIGDAELYESLQANTRDSVASTFDLKQTAEELHRLFEGERL